MNEIYLQPGVRDEVFATLRNALAPGGFLCLGERILPCDIGLPTMDGYEVACTFRSDDERRSTYMIALTGYATEDRDRPLTAGFDHHVGKPPDIEQLHPLVARLRQEAAGEG